MELKEKWVTALRYGAYEQTSGRLRRGNSFCCLGVLCDIVDPSLWVDDEESWFSYGDDESFPPQRIEAMFRGSLPADVSFETLAALNDDGASFSQIADVLEYKRTALDTFSELRGSAL